MMAITNKNFQFLTDIDLAWNLLTKSCMPFGKSGMPAPFFEYALSSSWMDKNQLYLNRFWMDANQPVGFVYYENPANNIFFALLPGYEYLAEDMIAYAERYMPKKGGERELVLFPGQKALVEAAEKNGYSLAYAYDDMFLDFDKTQLNFPLPGGFHFVDPQKLDPVKLAVCCWKGFDHEDKGPFENWDGEDPGTDWNPQKAYQGVINSFLAPPPHATYEHTVVIADESGEYACYSGMCWVKENRLAYMEPLCTIPKYRGMGLAAAALSKHDQALRPMGAKYMTGGDNPFYRKIGYTETMHWMHYKKEK